MLLLSGLLISPEVPNWKFLQKLDHDLIFIIFLKKIMPGFIITPQIRDLFVFLYYYFIVVILNGILDNTTEIVSF